MSFACVAAFVAMCASTAHAAPPTVPPPPAPSAPPSAPLPPPAPPVSQGQSVTVLGGYTCEVSDYASVDPEDAHTTADLVCHALATRHATPGVYDIRIGKLGSKVLLAVTDRSSGDDRRLFLEGIEEAPVAADRLAKALVEHTTLEQTQNADNTVNAGSSAAEHRRVQVSWFIGGSIVESLGVTSSPSAGIEGDVEFRLHRLSLLLQLRAGGIASASAVTSYGSADVGARYYGTDDDIAPFAGGGLSFATFSVSQSSASNYSGAGPAAYGEVGIGFLRSSFVGAIVSLRADVPMFTLNQNNYDFNGGITTTSSKFVIPVSLNVGLRLH
jgi:hypothetical protein